VKAKGLLINAQFSICATVKPMERCTWTQTNKYTWTWIQ